MTQSGQRRVSSITLGLLRVLLLLALFGAGSPSLHTAPSLDLFDLWEQTYNEPEDVLVKVKAMLEGLPAGESDERKANLYAIGAEAASFAEKADDQKQLAEAAIKIAEPGRYYWAWVHAVSTLGIYYEYSGQEAQAVELYQKSIQLADEAQDPELVAYAHNNLGYYYARNEKPKESIEVISRAMRALKDRPQGVLYHDILNNLAIVYTRNEFVGRADEGRRMLTRSIEYFKFRQMRYMIGNNYINLAYFHRLRGEFQVAIDTFKEAIVYARQNKQQEILPYYLMQMADTLNEAGRHREAMVPNEEALTLFREFKNSAMAAGCLLTRATILIHLKRPKEALAALDERLALIKTSDDYRETELELDIETTAWQQLGDAQKELAAARRWLRAARRMYNQNNSKTMQQIAGVLELERKDAENKLLEEQNRTNTLRLEQADRMSRILIGLLALSLLLIGFMFFAARQSRVIRSQRDRMQEVLDNIEEGILRFGKDFKIKKEYSAHVPLILDTRKDVTGQDVFTVLFSDSTLGADEQAVIRAALANVFDEDDVSWTFNEHHLPTELHRKNRVLNLLWQPHYDGHGKIDKILLVIRDNTSNKTLEAEVQASRQAAERLTRFTQELLQANPGSLEHFMGKLEEDLKSMAQTIQDPATEALALRHLHTIKGNARSLGLMDLAEAAHQLESAYKNRKSIDANTSELVSICQQYKKLYGLIFQSGRQQSASLLAMVNDIQTGLLQQFQPDQISFGSITVKDEVGIWPSTWQEPLRVLLLHALNNAVDHGYVLPHHTEAVRLQVEALRSHGAVRLCIRDRGCGIRWDKLRALAQERRFKPEPGRPLTDLLFADGVSTSEAVSLSSGRGVGLAAVKDACRELGAEVTLLDNDEGQGTMLVVDIPAPAQALSA